MSNNDGGPAFPQSGGVEQLESPMSVQGMSLLQGMSLRDYFAAKALQGLLADGNCDGPVKTFVLRAYSLADGMLAARST